MELYQAAPEVFQIHSLITYTPEAEKDLFGLN